LPPVSLGRRREVLTHSFAVLSVSFPDTLLRHHLYADDEEWATSDCEALAPAHAAGEATTPRIKQRRDGKGWQPSPLAARDGNNDLLHSGHGLQTTMSPKNPFLTSASIS
jgi:hypothetical protein